MTLVLKALRKTFLGYTSYTDFVWSVDPNVPTIAPDFDPSSAPGTGGGLHGFRNGVGNSFLANIAGQPGYNGNYTYLDRFFDWVVLDVPDNTIVDVDGAVKFPQANISFKTNGFGKHPYKTYRSQAANYILDKYLAAQNVTNAIAFTGYRISIPIMNVQLSLDINPASSSSPYDGSNKDVWVFEHYNEFTDTNSVVEYVCDGQYEYIFGEGVNITTGLHGSHTVGGNKFVVGDFSTIASHATNSVVVTGNQCSVDMALAIGGENSSTTCGDFCTVNVSKNTAVTTKDFCYIRAIGTGHEINCGHYCQVVSVANSNIICGDRCNISVGASSSVKCGVGCVITVLGDKDPTKNGPTYVSGGKGTTVRYVENGNADLTSDWIIGFGLVEENKPYTISGGKVLDNLGNFIPVPVYDYNLTQGAWSPSVSDGTGPASIYSALETNPVGGPDKTVLSLEDRFTDDWKKFFDGFGSLRYEINP